MRKASIRRRPVESIRKRLVENYTRSLARSVFLAERDFFDVRSPRRGVEVRFQGHS